MVLWYDFSFENTQKSAQEQDKDYSAQTYTFKKTNCATKSRQIFPQTFT